MLDYAVRVIRLSNSIYSDRAGNHVAMQLVRSGTSPSPHHAEAQGAESAKDFIHKMKLGLKELRESDRWLKMIQRVPLTDKPSLLTELLNETEELIKIFVSSINTAKSNQRQHATKN